MAIEAWRGEVVIQPVCAEAAESIEVVLEPCPYISKCIMETHLIARVQVDRLSQEINNVTNTWDIVGDMFVVNLTLSVKH